MTTNVEPSATSLLAILSCMNESYALLDEHGTTVGIGPREEDLLGRTGEEVLGLSGFTYVHPDDLPVVQAGLAELLSNPGVRRRGDVRCLHHDGSWKWLRAEASNLLGDPAVNRIVVTFSDITVEREAREALASRTTLAQRVAQELDTGVWVRRLPEWEVLFVSDGISRIWGRPGTEVLATPASLLGSVHPEDRHILGAVLLHADSATLQYRILRADGEERTLTSRRITLRDPDGSTVVAGFVVDITDELRLREAAGRAEQLEGLSALSLRLAHDFGNFVAAIQASAETLKVKPPTAAVEAEADLILNTCGRATDLVRRLLLVGRGAAPAPREMVLTDEVAQAMTILRRSVAPGVSIALDCTMADLRVRLDPLELHQVLMNLVTNANRAMNGQGSIAIGTEAAGNDALLWVSDTGPGIPPALRDRVFEPFATTRRGAGGTGLGLATVRAIVAGASGKIAVGTGEAGGARIEIRLPRCAVQS